MERSLSVQIRNMRVDIQAVPMMAQQGIAYFTFIKTATSERRSFSLDQASFLADPLPQAYQMLYSIWGRIDDPYPLETLHYHLSVFCHGITQQRNGVDIGFFIYISSQTAGILQQQWSVDTDVRGEMIDEGLVFTASEQGLDQTVIAKLEKVGAAGVLDHDDRCSICLEGFKEIMDDLGLARTPCSHMFHYDCIVQWLKMSQTCPLCRREIG